MGVDVRSTLESLERRGDRLSWSQYKSWSQCPAKFLVDNHAVFVGGGYRRVDDSKGVVGWVVQRFFEGWFNERLYRRYGSGDYGVVGRSVYVRKQVGALLRTVVLPCGSSCAGVGGRYWFGTDEGKERLRVAVGEWGLDPVFAKRLSPLFCDMRKGWLDECVGKIEGSLVGMESAGWVADRTLSECFLEVDVGGVELSGYVDFVVNVVGGFEGLHMLEDGYVLLDGKNVVGSWLDRDQLMFYAMGLWLRYGKSPGALGFWSWSRAEATWYAFTDGWRDGLLDRVRVVSGEIKKLRKVFSGVCGEVDVGDLVSFNPSSSNCRYCSYGDCPVRVI